MLKTEDDIQARARRYGRVCLVGVVIAIVLVSLWTPLMSDAISRRWFSWPNIVILSPVPIATALVALATWRALIGGSQSAAFIGAIGLFALSYLGIAISLWPMIVPHHLYADAGRLLTEHAGLSARRHAVPAADHPGLLRLVVLGVSRKGARRRGLSLRFRLSRLAAAKGQMAIS